LAATMVPPAPAPKITIFLMMFPSRFQGMWYKGAFMCAIQYMAVLHFVSWPKREHLS
jgi:hypothetical protein